MGQEIRARRRALGLSMGELAAATELSISFISMIELGKSDVSVGRLMRIVDALDLTWLEVLERGTSVGPVIRRGAVPTARPDEGGVAVEALAPALRGIPSHRRLVFEPTAVISREAIATGRGETFCLVLAGELLFDFQNAGLALLGRGDSVSFANDDLLGTRNPGRTPSEVYVESIAAFSGERHEFRDETWI